MKKALIYDDEGASIQSVIALKAYFNARSVTGAFLQDNAWISKTDLLIIPGGRSLPFYQMLTDAGNRNIIQFVKEGGTYLGVCAGAYYAARKTLFARGLPHEIVLDGALSFFEGEAIGPVFSEAQFDYGSEAGARIVDVIMDEKSYPVYFNGGCYFSDNPFTVARYLDNGLSAMLAFSFGKGRVVLSGVHPELDFTTIPNDADLHHQSLRKMLCKYDAQRRELLVKLSQECYSDADS
ncbi:MAG: BPL-N domain-containing protein [Coxiellaceae bacterium]|nr:BPL-N domain-containing protein [Coxiellaceae bacterium]